MILIGIGSFAGALAITIGVLVLVIPKSDGPEGPKAVASTVTGAETCSAINSAQVQSILKGTVSNAYQAAYLGRAELPNNDTIDSCVFPFTDGGTAENNYHSENAFIYEQIAHVSTDTKTAFSSNFEAQKAAETVSGLGEKAVFMPSKLSDNSARFELIVYSGLKHYSFRIVQPEKSSVFTAESARTTLTDIARTVSF